MRANRIRQCWERGEAAVNGWLLIPDGFSAELMSHQGWDCLTVDMQHGLADFQVTVAMLTAISTGDTAPVVRIPWLDAGIVMRVLDAGAYGVICPMIETAADVECFVSATRYPPRGNRSFGPLRATLYAGSDYVRHADDTIVRFAMIETRRALDNLDDILSVEGLDAVYIGPADLSSALGYPPGMDPEEPEVVEAIEHTRAKAAEHGVVAGIHTGSTSYAKRMIDQGFRFVTVGMDAQLIADGAQAILTRMRPGNNGAQ